MNSPLPPGHSDGELERFLADWSGYVLDNNGATPEGLREAFLSERDWLARKAAAKGGLEIWRMVMLPAGADASELAGSGRDMGRFWTLSRSVAERWCPGGCYSEDHAEAPEDGVAVLLMARVGIDGIDMVETAACRIASSWEDEIRLRAGVRASILSAEVLGGPSSGPRA